MTHICVNRLTIIGSDIGLSPGRRQAIIWTNAGILLIGPLGTNFSENLIEILTFSFTKMRLNVSSAKWRPFCLGLNVLTIYIYIFSGSYWCHGQSWFLFGLPRRTDTWENWWHLGVCVVAIIEWPVLVNSLLLTVLRSIPSRRQAISSSVMDAVR